MIVIRSEFDGFCAGIRRAVSICAGLRNESDGCRRIRLSHLICHNREVNERLGIKVVADADFVGNGMETGLTVVIGAHGVGKGFSEKCAGIRNLKMVSAVCPVVDRNLNEIKRLAALDKLDRLLVYLGKNGHSEADAAREWMPDGSFFIACAEDAKRLADSGDLNGAKVELMVQTSFSDAVFDAVCAVFRRAGVAFEVFGSICSDCMNRRKDAVRIAEECDAVVIVGDGISSNAVELAEIVRRHGKSAFVAMNASEMDVILDSGVVNGHARVGLISSASSSKEIFEEVLARLEAWYG